MSAAWVTTSLLTGKSRAFSELKIVGNWAIWKERSAQTKGKSVLCGLDLSLAFSPAAQKQTPVFLSPESAEIGSKVNIYGGGSWAGFWDEAAGKIVLLYADSKRGGVFQSWFSPENPEKKEEIQLLPPCLNSEENFYGDFAFEVQKKGVFAVKQCCSPAGKEKQEIVFFPLKTPEASSFAAEEIYVSTKGYLAAPRPSPCGTYLAFFEWQEGEMPWTDTDLKLICLGQKEKKCFSLKTTAEKESLIEPHWLETDISELHKAKKAVLYALSDRSGAWTPVGFDLFKEKGGFSATRQDFPQAPEEIGTPPWQFQLDHFCPLAEGEFLGLSISKGVGKLWHYTASTGWKPIEGVFPERIVQRVRSRKFVCLEASPEAPAGVVFLDFSPEFKWVHKEILRQSWTLPASVRPEKDISLPQRLEIPVSEGIGPLYALYYPPLGKRPQTAPLLVSVHGGPTGFSEGNLSLKTQYWTSRGFGVLAVDYRGSSSYGRAYREALNGEWGRLEVMDCCQSAAHVLQKGLADPRKCVIRGSSSGGLTALGALAMEMSPFAAACSRYGVTDLSSLRGSGTHRFEAYYVEGLVGNYPEKKQLYKARSPLYWPERLTKPVLFLHGGKDPVVPVAQAQALAEKLPRSRFHLYPEEGHGFGNPENAADALAREYDFYQEVFRGKI